MIRILSTDAVAQPTRWVLCFKKSSKSRLVRLLACGRYKHVCAFGYVEPFDAWLFFEVWFRRVDLRMGRGAGAKALMAHYIDDADLVGVPARPEGSARPIGFWCVPALARLVGLNSGALRPDALYRDCLAFGGELIDHDIRPAIATAGPDASSPAAAGQGGSTVVVAGQVAV